MVPVSKLCDAAKIVLDPCAGTLALVRGRLQLTKHNRFAGSEKDSACFQEAPPSLVEIYSQHDCSLELNAAESEEKVEASRRF